MDLDTILKKTKEKSDRVQRTRNPVYIAMDDRPYDLDNATCVNEIQIEQNKLITNRRQTVDKPVTNRRQIDYQPTETVDKPITNRRQTVAATDYRTDYQPITNRRQTVDKPITETLFSSLVGLQRNIVIFLYQECKKSRARITERLTLDYINGHTQTSIVSLKSSIYKLTVKGCIIRAEFKNGRGGWTRYELPDFIFNEVLQNETVDKLITNRRQTVDKLEPQPITKPITELPSSSSIYKTTTTKSSLPDEWSKIDINNLSGFGFSENHLLQLYNSGAADPRLIQESIEHFSFDLLHNKKGNEIKTSPLSYFMGILKRYGVYTAPENYESPKDHALRVYLEQQKAIQEKRAFMEKQLSDIAFHDWLSSLNENEKQSIIPEDLKRLKIEGPKTAALRSHFDKVIWASQKSNILLKISEDQNGVA